MKCEICGKTSPLPPDGDGTTLYRTSPVGEPAVWRCEQHLTQEQRAKIPSTVFELAKVIEGAGRDEIEDKLEELWLEQKGVDPDTGKMWLTPRMEREAKVLAEQGITDVHPVVSLAFQALARGQAHDAPKNQSIHGVPIPGEIIWSEPESGYLIDEEDERAEAAAIDREIEEEKVEQIIAASKAKFQAHIDPEDEEPDREQEAEDKEQEDAAERQIEDEEDEPEDDDPEDRDNDRDEDAE